MIKERAAKHRLSMCKVKGRDRKNENQGFSVILLLQLHQILNKVQPFTQLNMKPHKKQENTL